MEKYPEPPRTDRDPGAGAPNAIAFRTCVNFRLDPHIALLVSIPDNHLPTSTMAGRSVKHLGLLVLLLTIPLAEINTCKAFTIKPYQPVSLKQTNSHAPDKNNSYMNHGPTFVQSSFITADRDCRDCDKLKEYIEELTHVYYGPTSTDAERLQSLKSKFRNFLGQALPPELARELPKYESLCECVSTLVRSGLTLRDIYARKLCGDDTTRGKRMEIIAKCKGCSKNISQR